MSMVNFSWYRLDLVKKVLGEPEDPKANLQYVLLGLFDVM